MKEENINRAKTIQGQLEKYRGMLAVIKSNDYKYVIKSNDYKHSGKYFGIEVESRTTYSRYNVAKVSNDEFPTAPKEVVVCLLKSDIEQKIKALEAELATP